MPVTVVSLGPALVGAVKVKSLVQVLLDVREDPHVPPVALILPDDTAGENVIDVIVESVLFFKT